MKLLELLTQTNGVSGNEESVCEIIRNEIKDYADEIYTDSLGNLIVHKKGNGKKLMLAAHSDEIGVIITYIEDNGFLRFAPVGGVGLIDSIAARVRFSDGTIGVVSYEEAEDVKKSPVFKHMYIDIGADSREEAEKLVGIGDVACFVGGFYTDGKRIVSKALDNRIGVYALIEAAKRIKSSEFDIYYVFTSQEEIGLRGARTSAYTIKPDYSLSVDVTATGDTPNCNPNNVKLGGGACIKIMDRSVVSHPQIRRALSNCAEENSVKVQNEVLTFGGTDAGAIHTSGTGVVTGGISVPIRYIHSVDETAYLSDLDAVIELIRCFAEKNYIEN